MTDSMRVTTVDLETALLAWMPQQRWFAAKGSVMVSLDVVERVPLGSRPGVSAEHVLVDIGLGAHVDDGGQVQRYQVPLGFRRTASDEVAAWQLPMPSSDIAVYDGLRDPAIIAMYGDALAAAESIGPIDFRSVAADSVNSGMLGRVLGAEQSNTSVVLGEVLLLKFFRRVAPGVNPDIELHRALADTGCRNVAPLHAWIEMQSDGELSMLGMAHDFVADSAEGWTTALTSVRDLLASGLAQPDADFAPEAYLLGEAVAHVHADLAQQLGTSERPAKSSVDEILERVEAAAEAVPGLAAHLPAARELIARAEAAGTTTVQRIHGDLHLGQVLRTPSTWLLIDFEGEPAKSLEERRRPDSALRDVAGMLRSFDYAAHNLLLGESGVTDEVAALATEWVERNSSAFCDGYASVTGSDPRSETALLGAYELDKAVYEAVYEARNRPTWLDIPMRAIRRLAPAPE
ncbi:maltokinase N-terminal cap-like domain-containing protein [Rhodococcus sovatensis]|uniref:Maltokinase n=1 Tax=Rhodococcus sovatensis TaxID=1805840 RepID=A0ABZ2PGG1_9NOCA